MQIRVLLLSIVFVLCHTLLTGADQPDTPRVIRDAKIVVELSKQQAPLTLHASVLQGIDFRAVPVKWGLFNVRGAVFLGCKFRNNEGEEVASRGAVIFPALPNLPYDPYRSSLYTPAELRKGNSTTTDDSLDFQIYNHFLRNGRTNPDIMEALAERIHDASIENSLQRFLKSNENGRERKIVAIMGGHNTKRSDPFFKKVAQVAQMLVKEGYFVTTGGGPGMMEAGNLGAYLGAERQEAVDEAIELLKKADLPDSPQYDEQAYQVLKKYPKGCDSLAIPTWFYGHEPSNLFSSHIAKYFSNGLREDILISTAKYGIIFTPGSAGTTQEVFMTSTQNYYGTYGYFSPMIFLGKKRYTQDTKIFPLLQELAKGKEYQPLITISDEPVELVNFLKAHPPIPKK
jgi:predicted Rossmann-fold nucleotide-binding protein